MTKVTHVQCDHSCGTYYVREIRADGTIGDDEEFPSKAKAERAAAKLAREHGVGWETNY